MPHALRLTALALFTALCHCGGYATIRAAEEGQIVGLSARVDADVKRGAMGKLDAFTLARTMAQNEVDHARGALGSERIHQLQSCARHIEEALERRSEGADPSAAAAVMVRLEAGLIPVPEDFVPWAMTAPGELMAEYREVGARVLMKPEQGALRRKLFTDGDQAVRLAALTAAAVAADPADIDALLEAARLDPYPLARTKAIRAAGAIGGERVVLALKDLWASADEPARQAITDAWAMPHAIRVGGRRELAWAADTQRGSPAIAAAFALVRSGGAGDAVALAVLERAILSGLPRERIFALQVAPISAPSIRAAILKAEADPDQEIAFIAAAHRFVMPKDQGGATDAERPLLLKKLLMAALEKGNRAYLAKSALARGGAKEVLPLLDRDIRSADPQARKSAGLALVELGELPRAAVAAVDIDPRVRVPVSCAILRTSIGYD